MASDTERSELSKLMYKNAYGEGLSCEEYLQAETLIKEADETEEKCWVCKMNRNNGNTISDLEVCRVHAHYALITKK